MPYLKQAMDSPQTWEEPFFFYAELLAGQGSHAEAIEPRRNAILATPRLHGSLWTLLARTLMSLGRLERARDTLLQAIAINPKHPQPNLLLSQIYFRLGDETKAASARTLSLQLRRQDPGALEKLPGRRFPR